MSRITRLTDHFPRCLEEILPTHEQSIDHAEALPRLPFACGAELQEGKTVLLKNTSEIRQVPPENQTSCDQLDSWHPKIHPESV